MIKITYEPSKYKLRMQGHAGYNKPGEDIVCASASMLFYTLAQSLKDMSDGLKKPPEVKAVSGNAIISCIPKEDYRRNVDLVYWTVLNGFDLLARNYPGFVKFLVVGEL